MSVWLCSRSAGNTWSVNFRKIFFFGQKTAFLKNLRGGEHFSLYFLVKSEMGSNFQLHPRGVGSVNFRKMAFF